jgi:hypothetical protein
MKKRGKILRDPFSGAGLLMIEGRQYTFSAKQWNSATFPRPGFAVEVEVDSQNQLLSVAAVSDMRLSEGQAGKAMAIVTSRPDRHWSTWAPRLIQFTGLGFLAASYVLLNAGSIQTPFQGKLAFTLWQLPNLRNAGGNADLLGTASYTVDPFSIAAIAAWAAPVFSICWKDRRTALSGVIPLCFIAMSAIRFLLGVPDRMTVSFGIGSYVSAGTCLVLAINSVNIFCRSDRNSAQTPAAIQRAA